MNALLFLCVNSNCSGFLLQCIFPSAVDLARRGEARPGDNVPCCPLLQTSR